MHTKGAAELMLGLCRQQLSADGSIVPLSEDEARAALAAMQRDGERYVMRPGGHLGLNQRRRHRIKEHEKTGRASTWLCE